MRILQIIPYYLPSSGFGGPITVLSSLVSILIHQGHAVTIATTDITENGGRIPIRKEVIGGAEVLRFPNIFPKLAINFSLYTPVSYYSYIQNKIRSFDIIHIHDFFTFQNVLTCIFAEKYHIPVIIQPHGAAVPIASRGRILIKKLFVLLFGKRMLRTASSIVCISDQEKQRIAAFMPELEKKLIIIPNSTSFQPTITNTHKNVLRDKLGINKGAIVLLTLSRLHKIKRIDRIIRAFSSLHNNNPKTLLLITGPDAGEKPQLIKLVNSLDIAESVRFVGGIYDNEKKKYFQISDIFVSLSNDDPFGLTVLEALSYNLPVCITSSIGIAKDIEKLQCGIVTKNPNNISQVANDIMQTYKNRILYQKHSSQLVKRFNIKQIEKMYLSLCNKLTSHRIKPNN